MPARFSRSVVPLALFAAVLVVALNTWFAVSAVRSLLESEAWLAHTWEVVGQEERLMLRATNAETSARAYVITGREDFLGPYNDALRSLPQDVLHFKNLTLDNPMQQAAIEKVKGVIERRMTMLQQSTEARRTRGFEEAAALVSSGVGTAEMTRLRTLIGEMDAEERRLLTNRADEARHNGARTLFAVGLACVLDLLMICFVTWYFWQERSLRVAAEVTNERLAVARAEAESYASEVRELNAGLEQRVRDRTAELESTNRELEAFSYSVSHDLRAPLRTIDGFSLALMEDYSEVVDDAGRDYIRRVRAGVQRMGQLIDALLQLSRITRAEIVREAMNPAALAEVVVAALREENPDRKLTFTLTPGPDENADPKLVQVALENLLGNAVKFTSRREHAEISFGWDTDKKAWRVQDNGAGFDMHYADKLFNAFNRLHGDKDFKGSGIGLATVARVIRRHHGRIWADSEVDHATFWFTLG
jgi:signal transduction histidine kinase